MICTVIQNRDLAGVLEALEHCEMAEIRLDRCPLSLGDIRTCFASDVPLVATCRVQDMMASDPSLNEISASLVCEKRLVAAIEAGARFVDVEIEAPRSMAKRVRKAAFENGTVFIRSYHNYDGTDSLPALMAIEEKCRNEGAEIVKIVTMAHSDADVARVMSLYDDAEPGLLLAFCMGEQGRESRIDCLKKGALYTYAALSVDEAAAPGQWTAEEMAEKIYGNFRFVGANPWHSGADNHSTGDIPGEPEAARHGSPLHIPSSKSFAQRAIIASALADGVSHLSGYTPCGDNESAIKVAESLGAEISREGDVLTVRGIGAESQSVAINALNVGESGLLTRLMIPLAAQIAAGDVVLSGEKTLLHRPMKGVKEIMEKFNVGLESMPCAKNAHEDTSMGGHGCLVPVKIKGHLAPARTEISGRDGSQIISGLLMALPLSQRNSAVTVHDPKSIPYMFITLDVMRKFGVKVTNEMLGGREFIDSGGDWSYCTDIEFKIRGGQHYKAADFPIEGDWSSAANFLVAGAVFGKAELSGLDTTSLQADLSIMDILMDAGASLSQTDGEKGTIMVQRAPLNAFSVDASNCPDLFPVISVLAAFCQGQSVISGTDRLVHKESDRGKAILEMLVQMGVEAEIRDNSLFVEGHSLAQRILTGSLLKGGDYSSFHDHRMVMALKVAELGADSPINIDDTECVAKSFPSFFDLFSSLVGLTE